MNAFIEIKATQRNLSRRRPVCGVGINDAWYATSRLINGKNTACPFYQVWRDMIKRCYSEKHKSNYENYMDATLCDEWLIFSNFKAWMQKQDWRGKQIDKDLLNFGNKKYSPENCIFISGDLNVLISHRKKNGSLPTGVKRIYNSKKFQSIGRLFGKRVYIGCFDDKESASIAYKEFKRLAIIRASNLPEANKNKKIKDALIAYSEAMVNSYDKINQRSK